MKKSRFQLALILFFYSIVSLSAKSGNSTQVIKSGHWVYSALYSISSEVKSSYFLSNQPLSIGELKFYLKDIPYENLSEPGQRTYDKIQSFLNKNDDFFTEQDLRFFINVQVNPEFYYKTNPDIKWSFAYNYKDFALNIPLIIGFSDYFTIEPDFFIGKNFYGASLPDNFTNIPLSGSQFEFLIPRFAYGSTGLYFENWGVNFHIGKEGLKTGESILGSIIYNDTFETDCYAQLNLYTKWLKYTMDVVQVDNSKFFYLHQLDIRLLRNLRFGMIEGSLLNSDFELRYLNPFMLMHQFGSWNDYRSQLTEVEWEKYGEGRFCAYLAFTLEWIPFKNLRFYGLYSQNEILDLGGSRADSALSVPDSLGGQLGCEFDIPLKNGYLKNWIEGVYTSPYLYVKQSPDWSLYRSRTDMQAPSEKNAVASWMGSPFGPDCFAVTFKSSYEPFEKWKLGAGYLFKIHGENTAEKLFDASAYKKNYGTDENPDWIWTYYPRTKYGLAEDANNDEEKIAARDEGRNMWMSGVREYTHQISVNANYDLLDNLSFYGQIVYTFVINNNNIQNNFAHGAEFTLALSYNVLK